MKYIVLGLLAVLLVAGGVSLITYHGISGFSDGERVGYVFKLSKRGMLVKSWEGELNLAINGDDSSFNREEFAFSVVEKSIVDQLKSAMRDGTRVALTYEQYYVKPWKLDTSYVIVKVETLEDIGPSKE